MMKIKTILIFLIAISINCYPQKREKKNTERETIYLHPTPWMESSFKIYITNTIQLIALKEYIPLSETNNKNDTIHSILDSIKIRLKSGTEWNPTKNPPQANFLLIKMIFNKLDSADNDRLNYLKIISAFEDKKDYTNEMIDFIFFSKSFYNSENIKKLSVDYVVKPDKNGELKLFDKKITYRQIENH